MRFKIPAKQPSSFKASALYLAGRTKGQSPDRVDWMEVRNLETRDPIAAATIMEATAAQNLRCKKPTYHFVLSFDPKDARSGKVPSEVMREVAGEAIERMGLNEHQMMIYAHKDTKHPHMHFLINRVHPQTGKAFDRHNDGRKLTELCRDIARERGLNIPLEKERIRDKERVDDFDLVEALKQEQPGQVPEGEYWQAKREERAPQIAMDKAQVKALREKVQGHFYNAKDWDDLTARLGAQGVFLERKGQGLVLTNGERFAKLSQMGKGVRLNELEDRFGQRFDTYMAARMKELARGEAPEANIPGYDAMTPAERKRAERVYEAQKAVDQKRGDPVRELEAADWDYRYWSGVEAVYRAGERRISRLEWEKERLQKGLPFMEAREEKGRQVLMESLKVVFRDPEAAEEKWRTLETTYGIEEAQRLISENPQILGRMNGWERIAYDSDKRVKAKQAFRSLDIWHERREKNVLESLRPIFRNPSAALKKWRKLEQVHGVKIADRLVKENPNLIGRMHGRGEIGKDSAKRQKAKRAFRYLDQKRQRWREQQLKLGHHRDRIEANRRALNIALNDFEMMKLRTDVPFELKAIIRDKVIRRQKALSRVTEKAILESNLAEDRKNDLLRARNLYMRRKRERDRSLEHNRAQGLDYLDG